MLKSFFFKNYFSSDLLHGRRIARALWDYYKVSNIIEESCYVDPRTLTATGTEGADAGLSVMRLKELSRLVILDFKSKTSF